MIKNILVGLAVFAVSTALFGPVVGFLFGLGAFALAASPPSPVVVAPAAAPVLVPVGGPAVVPVIVTPTPRYRFWNPHSWSTPTFFRRSPAPHSTMNHATILPSAAPHHAAAVPHAAARPVAAPSRSFLSSFGGRPAASHAARPAPSGMGAPRVVLPGRPGHR